MTNFPDRKVRLAQGASNSRDPDRPRSAMLRLPRPRSREEKLADQRERQARYVARLDERRDPPTHVIAAALLAVVAKSDLVVEPEGRAALHPIIKAMFERLIEAGYDPLPAAKRILRLRRRLKDWS